MLFRLDAKVMKKVGGISISSFLSAGTSKLGRDIIGHSVLVKLDSTGVNVTP